MVGNRRVSVDVDANISPFVRSMQTGVGSAKSFAKELESADSRMANLVQSGLALAPAFTPLGAAAVPAIAGITTALGFTVAAAGTTVLAFQGVGDALKALNEFQIDPSSDNLEKLNEKLDALGPAGEVFVRQLQAMRPELQALQDIAQQELFPGMAEGLEEMLELGPQAEDVIGSLAGTMGDLFAEAGDNLNDPRWIEFFEYLDREARPVLTATAKSIGNFAEGITNLVMATDPMSDDFLAGLLDRSREFVEWSDQLDSTEGYQNFLAYVSENGPQAMDTLGAIGGALVEVVEATAPVGAVVLPILEDLANIFAAFMDTPAGPVLVAVAAAVDTLGRSMALLSAVGLRNGDSMIGKALGVAELKSIPEAYRQVTAAQIELKAAQDGLSASAVKARDAQFAFIPTADKRAAISAYSAEQRKVAAASDAVAKAEEKRTAALRAGAVQMGKTLAVAGGFAAVTSGITDDLGLSNAALGAMAGSMLGGWGAAVGGGVGLLFDFGAAGDDVTEMMKRLDKSVDGSVDTFAQQRSDLKGARAELLKLQDAAYDPSFGQNLKNAFSPDFWDELIQHARDGSELYGDELKEWNKQTDQLVSSEDALYRMGRALDMVFEKNDDGSVAFAIEDLEAVAKRAAPALDALGLTLDEISKMDPAGQQAANDAIRAWLLEADTAEGRNKALAESFRGLDDEMLSTAEAAFDMKDSLDALLSPGLNVSEATDAWRDGLRHLNDELDKNNGSLFDNTDAASQNREVIRGRVKDFEGLLVAEAEAGAGSARLSGLLKNQRNALIDAGVAAGIGRGEMVRYVNQLGLTPKMVRTVIEAQTKNAEADVERVRSRLDRLNQMKPSPKVDAQIEAAEAKLKRLLALLDAADRDRSSTVNVTTYYKEERIGGPRKEAAFGGYIRGPGTTTSDSIPALLSDKEYVHKAAAVEKYGIAMFDDINAMRFPRPQGYANGGPVRLASGGILGTQTGSNAEFLAVMQAAQAIRELQKSLAKDGKDRLKGNARNIAEQELKVAQDTLREAKKGVGQGARDKTAEKAAAAAQAQIDAAELQKDAAQELFDAAEQAEETYRAQRDAYAAEVGGSFNNNLFGNGLAGVLLQADADTNDSAAFQTALQQAVAAGLDGAAFEQLSQSGDLNTAQQIAAGGAATVNQFESAIANRTAAQASLGAFAQEIAYPVATLNALSANTALANQVLTNLNLTLTGLADRIEQASERGTATGAANRDVHRNRDVKQRKRAGK